jgi:outer membrane receptor for ferrienterochelin and colicins
MVRQLIQSNKNLATYIYVGLVTMFALPLNAQVADSLGLDNIVVTATRTERNLSNVAVPTTLIQQKTIQQIGSLRLRDVLQEQTGLYLTSGFGVGVQMQGLSSSYTLILIDGEPLVGRTSGVLDLNRLTVGNIKRIEIVKGPSSSLYGSEALAGVINIITDKATKPKLNVGLRYGSYNTFDVNVQASTTFKKLGINYFVNNYNTDGYSIRPYSTERSLKPIWRLTNQLNLQYPITLKVKANLGIRYNNEYIKDDLKTAYLGQIVESRGRELNKDLNITPSLTYTHGNRYKNTTRGYATIYRGSQKLDVVGGVGYDDYLKHQFYRVENQSDISHSNKLTLTVGFGAIREVVNSTRYDKVENAKKNRIYYGFAQAEFKPWDSLTIIGGLRFDDNLLYASALSPKVAMQYKINRYISLNGSYGRGFRAPDFRQLYLNFTNTSAGGYSVLGSLEAQSTIENLQQLGSIDLLEADYFKLASLKPEYSNGFNIGFNFKPFSKLQITLNAFRNDITDLIEVRKVAVRKGGSDIYSYINVQNAFTEGLELNANFRLDKHWSLQGGYQVLQTGDKDELKAIKNGEIYTRDAQNISRLLTTKEYVGLPNRSKHQANLKLQYDHENSFFANVRGVYRSQWAVNNTDGNNVYNTSDEFAKQNFLLNAAVGKTFNNKLRVSAGADNILDYTDVNFLPNMPGRTLFLSVNYTF